MASNVRGRSRVVLGLVCEPASLGLVQPVKPGNLLELAVMGCLEGRYSLSPTKQKNS